jgi:two-component system NtrC family response regulator
VQRAVLLATGKSIRPGDLELDSPDSQETRSLREAREQAEARIVLEALRRTSGNISKSAKELEISRPTLHDLLRKHGIDADVFRRNTEAHVNGDG